MARTPGFAKKNKRFVIWELQGRTDRGAVFFPAFWRGLANEINQPIERKGNR